MNALDVMIATLEAKIEAERVYTLNTMLQIQTAIDVKVLEKLKNLKRKKKK